ncbi:hypothetical protein SeLEV6574_g02678 [Synchytrium endobioticum]|nr:hypothetical protein SeLEV6574_g02678 [Synchytrium endobioticum]
MEVPRSQQDVPRPLPHKFSTVNLNKGFKGNPPPPLKVVAPRSGLQSLNSRRGSRLVSSLVPAPKYVDLPSLRSEAAKAEPAIQASRASASWVPNTNVGNPASRPGSAEPTAGESSHGKTSTSLVVCSEFPSASETAKPGPLSSSSNCEPTAWNNVAPRKSESLTTELDSAWADDADEEMDFSHPPVFDDEEQNENKNNLEPPAQSVQLQSHQSLRPSNQSDPTPKLVASKPDATALPVQILAMDKDTKDAVDKPTSVRVPPAAQSAWKPVTVDSQTASARYQNHFPDPRHPPPSKSSQPEKEILNWRHRELQQPHAPSRQSTTFPNDRHDHDERNRDERNRYLTSHPPQLLQRSPPSSRPTSEHEDFKDNQISDGHSDDRRISHDLSSVIGHQDARGLSEVRVEIRKRPVPTSSVYSHNNNIDSNDQSFHDSSGRNVMPSNVPPSTTQPRLYEPKTHNDDHYKESRYSQPSNGPRHPSHSSQQSRSNHWAKHDSLPERKPFGDVERPVQILKHEVPNNASATITPSHDAGHSDSTTGHSSLPASSSTAVSPNSSAPHSLATRPVVGSRSDPRRVVSESDGRRAEYAEKHRQKWLMERNALSNASKLIVPAEPAKVEKVDMDGGNNHNSGMAMANVVTTVSTLASSERKQPSESHHQHSWTSLAATAPRITPPQKEKSLRDLDTFMQRVKGLQESMKSDTVVSTAPTTSNGNGLAPTVVASKSDEAGKISSIANEFTVADPDGSPNGNSRQAQPRPPGSHGQAILQAWKSKEVGSKSHSVKESSEKNHGAGTNTTEGLPAKAETTEGFNDGRADLAISGGSSVFPEPQKIALPNSQPISTQTKHPPVQALVRPSYTSAIGPVAGQQIRAPHQLAPVNSLPGGPFAGPAQQLPRPTQAYYESSSTATPSTVWQPQSAGKQFIPVNQLPPNAPSYAVSTTTSWLPNVVNRESVVPTRLIAAHPPISQPLIVQPSIATVLAPPSIAQPVGSNQRPYPVTLPSDVTVTPIGPPISINPNNFDFVGARYTVVPGAHRPVGHRPQPVGHPSSFSIARRPPNPSAYSQGIAHIVSGAGVDASLLMNLRPPPIMPMSNSTTMSSAVLPSENVTRVVPLEVPSSAMRPNTTLNDMKPPIPNSNNNAPKPGNTIKGQSYSSVAKASPPALRSTSLVVTSSSPAMSSLTPVPTSSSNRGDSSSAVKKQKPELNDVVKEVEQNKRQGPMSSSAVRPPLTINVTKELKDLPSKLNVKLTIKKAIVEKSTSNGSSAASNDDHAQGKEQELRSTRVDHVARSNGVQSIAVAGIVAAATPPLTALPARKEKYAKTKGRWLEGAVTSDVIQKNIFQVILISQSYWKEHAGGYSPRHTRLASLNRPKEYPVSLSGAYIVVVISDDWSCYMGLSIMSLMKLKSWRHHVEVNAVN